MRQGNSKSFLDTELSLGDQRFELEKMLRNESLYLKELSQAFHMTGQHELAESLEHSASMIYQSADESQRIAVEELNGRVRETNQSVGETLSACLHMAIRSDEKL